MIITLSDNTQIEVVALNFVNSSFDWKRLNNGYNGICNSYVGTFNFVNLEAQLTGILESELITSL